jgi:hypothetical protein
LFAECLQEGYVDVVQESYCRSPAFYRYKVFPLFSAVYQGYTSLHEWPVFAPSLADVKDFASAMAVSIHLGHKVGAFTTMTTQMALLEPKHGPALEYLKGLVAMKLATMDVFAYGERLRDVVVTGSPKHTVRWFHNKPGSKFSDHTVPVVEASAWASLVDPEKKLLVLSNSSAVDRRVRVRCPDIAPGAALTDLQGRTFIYKPDVLIDVKAFSWRALLTRRQPESLTQD